MGVYQILGGRRLCGTVTVQGSKNAVLPMIAAAVLTKEEVVLEGCPKISDVEDMAEIVRSLGGTVWWERNALHMNCEKIEKSRVEGALSKRLRPEYVDKTITVYCNVETSPIVLRITGNAEQQ